MTSKFILYSSPLLLLFAGITIMEPWLYRNLLTSDAIENIQQKDFKIIAHKGASGIAPENTLASFQAALDIGVDIIELDVRQTKDEEIIVFHDQFLDRTTNGMGNVHEYTLEQLKQLDAGSWFSSKFSDQKIPTLKEVLDLVDGRCQVLIEIKHMDHPHYHDFSDKLVDVIRLEENGFDWVLLQSYEDKYLEEAQIYDDRIQINKMLIGEDSTPLLAFYIETKLKLGHGDSKGNLKTLNPEFKTLSPRRIFRMHSRGFKVFTYSVNTREDMIKMLNMGVDGIITDFPSELVKIRKAINS
ncbi:MAG: glycerophosphodiester phosphodiesterase [Cytophagales bacterium]|jgi:glycerophosphoryl diester phosphodiesterase|tara:strand:+ start:435 stop:1331 length:897 start_codon:yes stop_codon:yes gene_type:complete